MSYSHLTITERGLIAHQRKYEVQDRNERMGSWLTTPLLKEKEHD